MGWGTEAGKVGGWVGGKATRKDGPLFDMEVIEELWVANKDDLQTTTSLSLFLTHTLG